MDISFIGGGKRVEAYYRLFANRLDFKVSGFYCNPIKDCTDIAISTNTCLFSCIDDLCKLSDIIFIATEDEMLPAVIKTLTKLHIHNKIIVGIANGIYASDLDNGYENTYAVIDSAMTLEHLSENEICEADIVINGYGKRFDEFINGLKSSNIKYSQVSKPALQLFRAACHIVYYGTYAVLNSAQKLCKIATNNNINVTPIIKSALRYNSVNNSPYKEGRVRDVAEIADILDNNGIDSITGLYKAIGAIAVENASLEKDVADDMYKILRK